jgi:hypothetical protein
MRNKILFYLLIAFFFALLFNGLFSWLPFNSMFLIILFFAIFSHWQLALFWTITLGILLDGSYAMPTGVLLVSLLLTSGLIIFLNRNFFTSHSLYSVIILSLLGTATFEFTHLILSWFLKIFQLSNIPINFSFIFLLKVALWNTIGAVLVFLIFYSLSNRLKFSLLIKKSNQ